MRSWAEENPVEAEWLSEYNLRQKIPMSHEEYATMPAFKRVFWKGLLDAENWKLVKLAEKNKNKRSGGMPRFRRK